MPSSNSAASPSRARRDTGQANTNASQWQPNLYRNTTAIYPFEGETRVVGYFSKINNWNKSKRYGELPARQRGIYAVASGAPAPAAPACQPEPVEA